MILGSGHSGSSKAGQPGILQFWGKTANYHFHAADPPSAYLFVSPEACILFPAPAIERASITTAAARNTAHVTVVFHTLSELKTTVPTGIASINSSDRKLLVWANTSDGRLLTSNAAA